MTIFDSPNDGNGEQARIKYRGLPNKTVCSVEDDPRKPVNTGPDARKDPTRAGTGNAPQGMAETDLKWLICCTDGGVLTPPSSDPSDCKSKIWVEFKRNVNIAGDPNFTVAPICLAYQHSAPASDWLDPVTGGAYDDSVNSKAPVIWFGELNSDFCISGEWAWF